MKKKILFVLLLGLILYPANKVTNYNISSVNYKEGNHIKITEYLKANANNISVNNYNAGTKTEMYTFKHAATAQTPALTDYRYIGNDPYNYVKFNCDNDGTNCEIWRILGVFDVERSDPENEGQTITEQRIKLVRGSSFATTMYWNDGSDTDNNDWTNASLKTFLNGDYYNRTGNAATYGLKASARNLIDDAVYYLGAGTYVQGKRFGTTEEVYAWERGNKTCNTCYLDETKLKWIGKVALMYPSDEYMVYGNAVNADCYKDPGGCWGTTGWVYNSNILEGKSSPSNAWLLSPVDRNVCDTNGDGALTGAAVSDSDSYDFSSGVSDSDSYDFSSGVRPVVYLKSNVYYVSGDGSSNNPYSISSDDVIMSTNQNEDGNNETTIDNASTESNTNNKEAVVDAPNTLSFISKTLLIISGLLIVFGIGLYGYNLYKLKKNSK